MRCADCRPLLSKYVDGEALPTEQALVESHIGACAACSRLLVQFRLARARVHSLPQYQPDARLRRRLFAAIDMLNHPVEDVLIRRRAPAGSARPVTVVPHRRSTLFGHLASSFALVVVVAAGVLLWQIAGPGGPTPPAYATGTPNATGNTPVIPVPTVFVTIGNGTLPNAPSTSVAALPPTRAPGGPLASPTAAYSMPGEDAQVVHAVRDETYGYAFQYPAGWWTAGSLPVAGLLAHRLLRPWTRPGDPDPGLTVALDVLANPQSLRPSEALADQDLLGRWQPGAITEKQRVAYAGLDGFSLIAQDRSTTAQAIYLFAGVLVYRVSLQVRTPGRLGNAAADLPGAPVLDQVVRSFQADPDAGQHSALGYAPQLFLHKGEVWQADAQASAVHLVTSTGGQVVGFALAPDLRRLALVVNGAAGQQLVVQTLAQPAPATLWSAPAIHGLAWDGDQALVLLGGAPAGLYRVALGDTPPHAQLVADLSKQPALLGAAGALAVAPNRGLFSFLAANGKSQDLYAVTRDGTFMGALLGPGTGHPDISQYAWLVPADGTSGAQILLLADHQVEALTLAAENGAAHRDPLTQLSGAPLSDLAVDPSGHFAALAAATGGTQLCLGQVQTPGRAHLMPLPAAPLPGSLSLAPSGQVVFYRQRLPSGSERVLMIDAPSGTAHPLGDLAR